MEKERILSDLKTKIGDPNVAPKFSNITERTITEYVDKIFPTIKEGDVIDDSFYNTHVGILETLAGNIRFAASSAVEDFKKNLKTDPPTPQQSLPPKTNDPNDEITKKLKELEDFKISLEKKYQDESKIAKINEKRNSVLSKLKEQGADDPEILEYVELKLSIGADSELNNLVTDATKIYNDKYSRIYKGEVNPASVYGNNAAAKKNTKDAYLKHLHETGRIKPKTQI